MKPKLLDLFCKAGGTSWGYHLAGFDVTGVDIEPQKHFPLEKFVQEDAFRFLKAHGEEFDVITASPPCQGYSKARKLQGKNHPLLIFPIRDLLMQLKKPYVIENVVGAPLINPILLCGTMFGLKTYRHRVFESNVGLVTPVHLPHILKQVKMGRPVQEGDFIQIVGHFSGADYARKVMGTPWMTKEEMREAIPPAYTEFIGKQLIKELQWEK